MSMVPMKPRTRGRLQFATIYAGIWALLATAALAYLATLAVQPGLLGAWVPQGTAQETADAPQSVARFATDVTGLRQSVGEVKRDVASLQTAVAAMSTREKDLTERLAVVEERTKPAAVAEAPVAAAPKSIAQRQAEARAQKIAERTAQIAQSEAVLAQAKAQLAAQNTAAAPQANDEPPAASRSVTLLNASAPSQIATGSLQLPPAQGVPAPPPASSFGPGTVRVAGPPSAVELSSGPSLDALRLNWSLLAERHGGSLRNLEPRYTNGGEGQPYQLVAGPINSPEQAARVCADLRAKKVSCRVTGFTGNAL